MPKKKAPKLTVEQTTDPEVCAQIDRNDYGDVCEGFKDKDGNYWVTKRSLAAWRRRKEREQQQSDSTAANE